MGPGWVRYKGFSPPRGRSCHPLALRNQWMTDVGGRRRRLQYRLHYGKLSANWGMGILPQMPQDILADTPEISVDIGIGIAQDCEAMLPQKLVADFVGPFAGEVVMLRAVQLDDQFLFSNVEIHDIGINDLLAVDHNAEMLEKVVPKMPLVAGHVLPECSGQFG